MGGSSGHSDSHSNNNVQQQPQQVHQPIQQQNQAQELNPNDACYEYNRKFTDCMKFNYNNSNICQSMFDELRTCQNKMI